MRRKPQPSPARSEASALSGAFDFGNSSVEPARREPAADGHGARRQLCNYLRCTPLEVGLLLHFGPEPTLYRVVCPNSRKRPLVGGACGETSPTDERVKADAPDTPERADGKPFPEYPEHPL